MIFTPKLPQRSLQAAADARLRRGGQRHPAVASAAARNSGIFTGARVRALSIAANGIPWSGARRAAKVLNFRGAVIAVDDVVAWLAAATCCRTVPPGRLALGF